MERCRPSRLDPRRDAESLDAYVTRRLKETNDCIKEAARAFYAARYGISYVHRQLLLLQRAYKAEVEAEAEAELLPKSQGCAVRTQLDPIPRCSLVLTGATNAGKSYFINELLEISLNEQPIAPEFYQPCTQRILLIQDDAALARFADEAQPASCDHGSVALIEKAPQTIADEAKNLQQPMSPKLPTFREIACVVRDDYEGLTDLTRFLIDRNQPDTVKLGGSFSGKGKDLIVRVSNARDILSTGLQLVDFPGYGDGLAEIQKYVTSAMSFVKPTVCLWLLNKALFKELHDTEYIRKLQELYQERCKTQFIVAVGQVDQDEPSIESKNKHDINFYVTCVTGIASNMDRAMCRQEDADKGDVFANRLRYTVRAGCKNVPLDLLGISTVTLQDVKENCGREVNEFQWLHLQNWFSLKEDIAMAIRKHTREYVHREWRYFDQKLREFIHLLREYLSEVNNAHRQVQQTASELKDHVKLSRDCLKETVDDTLKRWKPDPKEIIREWDVEQENLNIKEMEYYKYNPRRQILTYLLNYNVGTKTKQLIVLTTDHTVHFLTRSFFDDFKKRTFNEKYSKNINDLFTRLQSMGYSANELPKSLEKALDILAEYYEVQRLIEDVFYSSFPSFFNDKEASSSEQTFDTDPGDGEALTRFIRSYVNFLIDVGLPQAKSKLMALTFGRIDSIFEPSIRVLRSREEKVKIKSAKKEKSHHIIDCRILPYCGYLNMCLSSLDWEFCAESEKPSLVECVRKPGVHLMSYARNLVEIKMLLDSFDASKKEHFVFLHSWRYDRRAKTIYVMKEGSTLRPVLDWLRTSGDLPESSKLKKCYQFGRNVLDGVIAIHRLNFIIDDLSPENIFLCQDASRALIDLDTMRPSPFASLRLSETDIIPPIHLHPDRFSSASSLSHIFDLFSFATVLWFLIDGTGSSQHLPKAFTRAASSTELQRVLRQKTPLIPEECDPELYEQMRDCWNLANKGLGSAIRMAGGVKAQLYKRLSSLAEP